MVDSNSKVEKEEMNGREDEFYDASNRLPFDEEHRMKKTLRRQWKMPRKLKKTFLQLKNGAHLEIDLQLEQGNHNKNLVLFYCHEREACSSTMLCCVGEWLRLYMEEGEFSLKEYLHMW